MDRRQENIRIGIIRRLEMKTFAFKLPLLVLLATFAFAASPSVVAEASQPGQSAQPEASIVTLDLVYLKTASGPVDVTSSLYTSQGQTYAVLNNVPVPIVVAANSDNVYSPSGSVIGYTVHIVKQ
jgi:hypothetical protein